MAYRTQKNLNGENDLVIDGFEKGIADSPFQGIANIRNLNIKYYEGVAYVNYKRQAATITGATMGIPAFATQSPAGIIYISDLSGNIFKQTAVNGSTFAALTGTRTAGAGETGLQFWNNYLFAFSTDNIDICGDGSGNAGVISTNWNTSGSTSGVWPIAPAIITLTGTITLGDTSATISHYTDAQGTSRAFWNGPTGNYFAANSVGQNLIISLTQGSSAITFTPQSKGAGAFLNMQPLNQVGTNQSLISKNDGLLYFCNGSAVGSFQVNTYQTFSKTDMTTFRINSAALSLPQIETATYLTELVNQLIVAVKFALYPWDRVSPQWKNPVPIQEQIYSVINILNNLYVFAGNKGNIYISNGYSIQRFKKMPDYVPNILAVIDPSWQWGGIMSHRQKLYFQALATNSQAGTKLFAGIFSIDLDTGALNTEAQNSFGTISTTTTAPGILIDNNSVALAYDNYYSVWSNGNGNVGGIDFNDTTLWSSNEPFIETDLIPIGTFAQTKTFGSMEFKLDQPLKSGDVITVYARQSLADAYQQIGQTTTALLSDFYQPLGFQEWQWIQFRINFTANSTASSSSFIRLREIRIR